MTQFQHKFSTIFFQVISLPDDLYPTDVDLFPKTTGAKKQIQNDIFVLTASDGIINVDYYFFMVN